MRVLIALLTIIIFLSSFSLESISSSQSSYYIQTTSPVYSILPGSHFIQPLNRSTELYIGVLLSLRNTSGLTSLLNFIYGSKQYYHHWLSPMSFDNQFYPKRSYVNNLISYLESYNLSYSGEFGDNLVLIFNGSVESVESAFHTYINVYYYPFTTIYWFGLPGITNIQPFYYYANNVTASVPYNVGKFILGIVGLNSFDPHLYSAISQDWKANIVKYNATDSSLISKIVISPLTIQRYFNFTQAYQNGYTGKGSTIAIEGVPEEYINNSDIYAFWNLYNVQRTGTFSVVEFGNDTSGGQSGENELDAEWAGAFSPGANLYVVFSNGYVGGVSLVGYLLNYWYELYYMINVLNPTEISISVTVPESYLAAYYPAMLQFIHQIMEQAAVEGISVLAASGDWGFESDHPPPNFIIDTYNTIWYPETDPYVTSVGGIFISVNSSGNITRITGWDYSTGGNSVVFPAQSYELTSIIPDTPKLVRTYPDIAFVSAGGFNIPEFGFGLPLIFQGQLFLWYGTSGAAPVTAAMVSLTAQRLGSLNFALYSISYQGKIFTPNGYIQGMKAWIPITTGGNPTPAHYGWNYVTGPGTYNAYAMIYDLILYSET
ncbi:peptidase S53 [Candidatus Acidianus copahuensis]|uniref:Peptidase S53 n=1 Tax=Candidatus Acidianus copahuensis TaxID=1160895 RepID=A0A031LS89_9CREN|nr:peptidase S53 [Candidatus Acidianus copahuensis]